MSSRFTGPRSRQGDIAWKLFVFGVDVTPDLSSSSFTFSDSARAPNTCELVLSNLDDKYIVTDDDISTLYNIDLDLIKEAGDTPGASNLADLQQLADAQVRQQLERNVQDDNKRGILRQKFNKRQENLQTQPVQFATHGSTLVTTSIDALRGDALRYPFHAGDCVFHSNDAVRLFVRDPLTLEWFYGFTGYVTDWTDDVDKDNKKIVTLRCEDVLRIFRYARITTNPAIYDAKAMRARGDVVVRKFTTESFATLSLAELMYLLIYGSTAAGAKAANLIGAVPGKKDTEVGGALPFSNERFSINGSSTFRVSADGIGAFNFKDSRVFVYGPPPELENTEQKRSEQESVGAKLFEPAGTLEAYQQIVDHKVKVSDLDEMIIDDDEVRLVDLDQYKSTLVGLQGERALRKVIDIIGSHPEHYPPDNGRFIMLLPGSLGSDISRNVLDRSLITSIATKTQFRTRLAMIYDIAQRIEFSFFATPKGDLLFEMPLYDFAPGDFGFGTASTDEFGLPADVSVLGPYGPRYTLLHQDLISWTRTFSDDKVRTMIRVPHAIIQAYKPIGTSDQIWQVPNVVILDHLLPQFGVRMEDVDPYGYIATEEAAGYYAHLKLNELNADARTVNTHAHFRFGIGPNRPILFQPKARSQIGTCRSVSYQITWGKSGSVGMTLKLNYTRGWSGQLASSGERIYEPLGGFASRPLNYALLFQSHAPASAPAAQSGDQVQSPPEQPQTSTKQLSGDTSTMSNPRGSISRTNRALKADASVDPSKLENIRFWQDQVANYLASQGYPGITVTSEHREGDTGDPHTKDLAFDFTLDGIDPASSAYPAAYAALRAGQAQGLFPADPGGGFRTFVAEGEPFRSQVPDLPHDSVLSGHGVHIHMTVPQVNSSRLTTPQSGGDGL